MPVINARFAMFPIPKGGQFGLHAKALASNPFNGHTLGRVITELEQQTGSPPAASMWTSATWPQSQGEVLRLDYRPDTPRHQTHPPRDETRRRGRADHRPYKAQHRRGRNYLKGRGGINAVLVDNFGLRLRWLARLLRALLQALATAFRNGRLA